MGRRGCWRRLFWGVVGGEGEGLVGVGVGWVDGWNGRIGSRLGLGVRGNGATIGLLCSVFRSFDDLVDVREGFGVLYVLSI